MDDPACRYYYISDVFELNLTCPARFVNNNNAGNAPDTGLP